MRITISVPEHRKDIADKVDWAVEVRGMAKSKFICNAIDYYYQFLQSDNKLSNIVSQPLSSSTSITEETLRSIIREVINEAAVSEPDTPPPKNKENEFKSVPEPKESVEPPKNLDQAMHASSFSSLEDNLSDDLPADITQEEQELFNIINAGLGME